MHSCRLVSITRSYETSRRSRRPYAAGRPREPSSAESHRGGVARAPQLVARDALVPPRAPGPPSRGPGPRARRRRHRPGRLPSSGVTEVVSKPPVLSRKDIVRGVFGNLCVDGVTGTASKMPPPCAGCRAPPPREPLPPTPNEAVLEVTLEFLSVTDPPPAYRPPPWPSPPLPPKNPALPPLPPWALLEVRASLLRVSVPPLAYRLPLGRCRRRRLRRRRRRRCRLGRF